MRLFSFHGGIQPPQHKAESTSLPILRAPVPRQLILPLQQHIGEQAEPLVQPGDHLLKGEPIARAKGYISSPIHASSSGTVVAIEERPVPHPSGLRALCVVIECDGEDRWLEPESASIDPATMPLDELRQRVRAAGVVGLGGAAFPSAVKLSPNHPIDTVILNGAECEPYISCDDMLMRERAGEILEGLEIVRRHVGAAEALIGIEQNKPEAATALEAAIKQQEIPARLIRVPTRYPAGGEKQLIRVLTGREVPSHGLPSDIGLLCHNPGTLLAVREAIVMGRPLLSRVVTVSGDGVATPRNIEALIGTPFADLIELAGGYRSGVKRLIMGGPMMGVAVVDDAVPIIKATNCILARRDSEQSEPSPQPCIRCGECARVCPIHLLPQQLYWFARAKNLDKAQDYHLFDCIDCGCCAYVCPSHIPLVQYFRFAKQEIWSQEREKERADQARQRHELRQQRLAREQREKEERQRRRKKTQQGTDAKKAMIAEALERAKAKRAVEQGEEPGGS